MVRTGQGRSSFPHVRRHGLGRLSADTAGSSLTGRALLHFLAGGISPNEWVLTGGTFPRDALEVAAFTLPFQTSLFGGLVCLNVFDLPLVGLGQFFGREPVRAGLDAPLGRSQASLSFGALSVI